MNVVVVEDNETTRQNLKLLLAGEHHVARVQDFACGEDALRDVAWQDVDILLTDLGLPDMSGIELIGRVRLNYPQVSCMVLTVSENRDDVFSAIKAGACGYLLKGTSPRELIESLHELMQGGAPMTPRIARKVIMALQKQDPAANVLTAREREILQSVDRGLSYKEIADHLSISPNTVHTHIKNIYEKVEACNREEALRKARRLGWI